MNGMDRILACPVRLDATLPPQGALSTCAGEIKYKVVCGVCTLLAAIACLGAEEQAFRAARSVHLSYRAPGGLFFYNEVVVEQSANGSYFMACGWDTGYFGIQQLDGPDEKIVLFSVWDPTAGDDPNFG